MRRILLSFSIVLSLMMFPQLIFAADSEFGLASPSINSDTAIVTNGISSQGSFVKDCYFKGGASISITDSESLVKPMVTCPGTAGVARINWLNSARMLTYSLSASGSPTASYYGTITVTSNGTPEYIKPIAGGGNVSDEWGFDGVNGTGYIATLSGSGVKVDGTNFWFTCTVSFIYGSRS